MLTATTTSIMSVAVSVLSSYSVRQDVGRLHLGQEVGRRELELILQVHLQQGVVVAHVILRTLGKNGTKPTAAIARVDNKTFCHDATCASGV